MHTALHFTLVVALTAIPAAASAQSSSLAPATTLVDLAARVAPGSTLIVTDVHGRTATGELVSIAGDSLTIAHESQARSFQMADISEIRHRHSDSMLNGGFIGFAAGFAVPAALCAAASDSSETGPCVVGSFLAGGLPGFLIGMGVDALIARKVVVFRTNDSRSGRLVVAPELSAHGVGVRATVTFGRGR